MSVKPLHAVIAMVLSVSTQAQEQHQEDHETHQEPAGITLSEQQRDMADIATGKLSARVIEYPVYAPGEVVANDFNSYVVSPRIDSTILRRFVSIGDHVEQGEPLATLFSARMADAQSSYLVALNEWQRVQSLGESTVGEKRFVETQNTFTSARAKLKAFGMLLNEIERLTKPDYPLGEYQLTSDINGIVVSDNFKQGQQVSAGTELVDVLQEASLWVNARLPGTTDLNVKFGDQVMVTVDGVDYPAKVIQEGHTIDHKTRTRTIRLAVDNKQDRLHPGLFADVYFTVESEQPVLAVQDSALMRAPDGDWQIFIERAPGQFEPQEVELIDEKGPWKIIDGVSEGTRYVSQGAFFVRSQIAKGGFDPHNH
jgi:multidrug efflux pump subunit AcrA (membrane-fusion protein)